MEELLTIKLCLLRTNVGIEGSSLASKHFFVVQNLVIDHEH